MALGNRLVKELGMDSSVDTLGRWMAHYVAELIDAAENAPLKERPTLEKKCFDAILELWSHHSKFPNGMRPFEDLEPIIRTLRCLDPNNAISYKISTLDVSQSVVDSKLESSLNLLVEVDQTARIIMSETLAEATELAMDSSKEWIKLAENIGASLGATNVVVKFVSNRTLNVSDDKSSEAERRILTDRIEHIETFIELANEFSSSLKDRLKTMP